MIEKININRSLIETSSSSGQPNSSGALPGNDMDVDIQVDYGSLIEKAMQEPQTDAQIVQKARDLLFSGELDSPEHVRKAAKNIVEFGI